ncbi:MAG TPA: tetratricopeptide repeat protein [Spirochaetota bacterium]|nr:tetratricopeptide repeat protein [Spirochaetota bacterium]HOM39169.1 tetratricopeptide repeat protein [Spirochaetota bacterium]HPQ50023.1 tetratricopeptide repeat protein [Spirochaetota bacterium]
MLIDPVFISLIVIGIFLVLVFIRRMLHLASIEKVEKLIDAKDYTKAVSLLKNIIAKDDENLLAHYYLGLCYFNMENYEWAMPEFKKVVRSPKLGREVDEIEVREKLAKIYLKYNQLEEAQKEFMFMTQINPKDYRNYFEIARILHKQGYLDSAFGYYKKTIERNPKMSEAYYYMGVISYEKKNYNDCLSYMNDALKYDPSLYKAHFYLGMVYYMNKHYEKALNEFTYSEKDPEFKERTVLHKGRSYMEMGQYDRAISLFEGYLKNVSVENSATLAMRYHLASIYETKRNIISAIEQWEKIVRIKPNYMDVQEKLSEYEDLRMDDRLKDFVVASTESFQIICRKIIDVLNYQIIREELISDDRMEFLAVESGSKWRNTRKIRIYVVIMRKNSKVEEREIAAIMDNMKTNSTVKAICLSVSGFTESARRYSESRPIDLIEKDKLIKLLEKAEEKQKEELKNKVKENS